MLSSSLLFTTLLPLLGLVVSVRGFVIVHPLIAPIHHTYAGESTSCLSALATSGLWNNGLSYGKGPFRFYYDFESWIEPFPLEDRQAYPELFNLPDGVYEISLPKPLGIVFEDRDGDNDNGKNGVVVTDLVEGGAAERQGLVGVGDVLLGVTAVKVIGAKWERRLIPATAFDFDTTVNAIMSNEPKWGCDDVVMMLYRPSKVDDMGRVKEFLEFFEPPTNSMWKLPQ